MFERGLKDLYDIAKHLRTNSCYINGNDTTESSTSQPPSSVAFSGNVVRIFPSFLFVFQFNFFYRNPSQ